MTVLAPTGPAEPLLDERRNRRPRARAIEGQEVVLAIVIAVIWAVLAVATDTFLTGPNLTTILYSIAPVAIIGVGMTAVIVTAGIDVSVGSQAAVVIVVVAQLVTYQGWGTWPALAIALLVGALMGLINGALVAFGNIHPIIVTFGTLNIFRFVALQLFGNEQVAGVPGAMRMIGGANTATTLGVPNAFWLAIVFAAAMWCYMRWFATGRHLYALGGNPGAARLSGVRVKRRLLGVYVIVGLLVGFAGCVLLGSGGLVQQNVGIGLELQVIAAVVIGGTSIVGGRGTVLGSLLGALLVGTVASAITHLRWPSELTNLFIGLFIIVAVGVDLVRQYRRNAR